MLYGKSQLSQFLAKGLLMSRLIPRVSPKAYEYTKQVLDFGFHNTNSSGVRMRLEKQFAKKFGVRYALTHTNGTTTMQSALVAAGVGAGDEVIVTPLTMAATGLVVFHVNAVPIFADVDPDTFTIDPEDIRRKVTKRTKAIIPVAIYGLAPDLDAIMEIAREYNLTVIEDNAQCFLGYYKGRMVGSIGNFASFSFQSSKHMTCGDGGILITDDQELARRARQAASFGYPSVSAKPGAAMPPEDQRFSPDAVRHVSLGYPFRMAEIAAGVALAELERLDELVEMRIGCAKLFDAVVRDCNWLIPQKTPKDCVHVYWSYVCRIADGGPEFHAFRRKFAELGGDGFYGAWRPTYAEPLFAWLNKEIKERPERYPHFADLLPDYSQANCPVTDRIQPNLVQFKTNYFDLDEAGRQADILAETLRSLC